MPTYTKVVSKHDRIEFLVGAGPAVDVSNAFRVFGMTSVDTLEDMSGFSVSGVDENLPGGRSQGFQGEAFYGEEFAALVWPLHDDRTNVTITWQPNGLIDPTALEYSAVCQITEFSPSNTRGSGSTTPFTATTADENGISQGTPVVTATASSSKTTS